MGPVKPDVSVLKFFREDNYISHVCLAYERYALYVLKVSGACKRNPGPMP